MKGMLMSAMQVALQLYTVRDEMARDYAGTIRRVGESGYTAVEMAGYGDMTALQGNLDAEIEYSRAIGCEYLVLPGLPQDQRTAPALRELAPRLTQIGQR